MPIVQFYPNGATSGCPPSVNNHQRAKRQEVRGWSPGSARRQRTWFYSVDLAGLSGHGCSVTLTLRDCPPDAKGFHAVRKAFLMRLSRMGLIRGHWLVEWQRRGVPHLHGCFYFEEETAQYRIPLIWTELTERWRTGLAGQCVRPIYEARGWLQYLAKHGARGVQHYQRSSASIPAGWKKTGRMWGYVGDWPIREPMRFELGMEGYWAYRRLVRGWLVAAARQVDDDFQRARDVAFCRQMLACSDRALSEVRGTSGWIPADLSALMVVWVGSQGHQVEQVA